MSEYVLIKTSSGKLTLAHRNSREIRLHSGYDPEREAKRAVDGFEAGRATIIAVMGIGLGYHLECLKEKYPGKQVCAVEHDPEVTSILRNTYPHHLDGVAVISSVSDLPKVFENLDIAGFRGIAHYLHRPSYLMYREFYDGITRDMNQYATSKMSDLLTRFEFEERWAENILSNLRHLFDSTRVQELFGRFTGYPGIIVSAGPSLRKNVDLLGEMRERALIVSVDTALKVLHKKNIVPHMVMTLDAQKYSLKHFLGASHDRTTLLADLVCYPAVLRSCEGKKIISTTSKYYPGTSGTVKRETTPLVGWIEKYADAIGDIQSGGSVATSVFDLLLNLGCSPIILVGQDLAYTGREIHAGGTYHNDDWLPGTHRFRNLDSINQGIIRRRKIKYVPAYGGRGEVLSDFVFDLYRSWFEDSASKVQVPVINATEGGARIRNTEEKTLEDMVAQCKKLDPVPEQVLDRVLVSRTRRRPERLQNAMRNAIESLGRARDLLSSAQTDGESFSIADEIVNREEIRELLKPFLRRKQTFATRYAASSVESGIVAKDIASALARLVPAMESGLRDIEGLSQ